MVANDGRRLIQSLRACLSGSAGLEHACVLATVVRTAGSTYRKAGAQMLVPAKGDAIGILSGGCLEDDIIKAARGLLAANARTAPHTQLLFFDLMPESEFLIGYGKGCSGQLTVLLERVAPGDRLLDRLAGTAEILHVALVYEAGAGFAAGDRLVVSENGSVQGTVNGTPAARAAVTAALGARRHGKPRKSEDLGLAGGARACLYAVTPPQELVIFGAGPDAPALARLADQLGWTVRVYDHRPARLDAARFPPATTLHRYNPETLGDEPATSARTAVVAMTHNLLVDAEVMKWAAARPLAYLGLLGPQHRRDRVYRWLLSQGTDLEPALAGRLYAPIGLDLGGDGGEWDIALAIVAQIQQLRHAATGAHKSEISSKIGAIRLESRPRGAVVVSSCALGAGEDGDARPALSAPDPRDAGLARDGAGAEAEAVWQAPDASHAAADARRSRERN